MMGNYKNNGKKSIFNKSFHGALFPFFVQPHAKTLPPKQIPSSQSGVYLKTLTPEKIGGISLGMDYATPYLHPRTALPDTLPKKQITDCK